MTSKRSILTRWAATLALALGSAAAVLVWALPTQAQQPKYTMAEYKAYQAAAAEQNAQEKLKLLDAFVAQYPTSDLLVYIYDEYLKTYSQSRNWPKVLEIFDKKLALPNLDKGMRLQALYGRAQTFELAYNPKAADAKDQDTKARDLALEGLKAVQALEKPANATDEQFNAGKKQLSVQFLNVAAVASMHLKDFKAAADHFHSALALNPDQPLDYYRLGLSDLQETPSQAVPGFWALARAIDLKVPDADKVTKFLRDKILEYQSPPCESAVDPQLKELLTLAQSSPDPPAGYSIPSAADLAKAGQREAPAIIADLRVGGNKGKITWLGVCNGVFPEAFLAKTYEVNASNPAAIELKAAIGSSEEELNASTAADTTLKITTQPDAARLSKDDIFRFAGKLTGYTPSPFQLSFEDVKINPEDIPAEKGKAAPKRPVKKPAGKQ
jgi:hypothetical protein